MNAFGSYVCECHAGYTGNERNCTHYSCLVVVELIDGKNVKKKEILPLTLQSFCNVYLTADPCYNYG